MSIRTSIDDTAGSSLDMWVADHSKEPEKMSKSRGNCVTVDMVIYGVASVTPGHEFRDSENRVIGDWKRLGIWQNKAGDGMFYTGPSFGTQPIFLCKPEEIIPSRLVIRGKEVMQHWHLENLWAALEAQYPDEFYEVETTDESGNPFQLIDAGIYSTNP